MPATVDLASIFNALGQRIAPRIVRQINRRAVILKLLRISRGRGKNCAWDVEGDGAYSEDHADGADVTTFGSDDTVQAVLGWARSRSNFKMTDEAVAAAQTNGDEAFVAYARTKLESAVPALASRLNRHVFVGAGAGSNQIVGLQTALSDTGSYAGLSRSTYPWFRSNVIDAAGAALSIDMARRAIGVTIYNACGFQPDFAFVDPDAFAYIGSLFQQQRRYPDPVREVMGARGAVKLDGSIGAIEIDGCVFIKDKDVPANTIVFINSDAVEIEFLPLQSAANMLPEAMEELAADDGFGPIALSMKVIELGRTGDARRFSLMVRPCLKVLRPNACGRLINFTMPTS